MIQVYFYFVAFILQFNLFKCDPPYFPTQIVFMTDDGYTLAIDEVNQRASLSVDYSATIQQASYVMKHFPYTKPGTPESKSYVQLSIDSSASPDCQYVAYWKYSTQYFNQFPMHWWTNKSSFEIKNYMNFSYEMIHSNQSSINFDYWYAKEQGRLESGEVLPCQEIYFVKNTSVPARTTQVVRTGMRVVQEITNYKVLVIGEPDFNLGVTYQPQSVIIDLNKSSRVRISLTSPPHEINGNSTVRIHWKETENEGSFKWSPDHFYFNDTNFEKPQILSITCVKRDTLGKLLPVFNGGGFDIVPSNDYPLILA